MQERGIGRVGEVGRVERILYEEHIGVAEAARRVGVYDVERRGVEITLTYRKRGGARQTRGFCGVTHAPPQLSPSNQRTHEFILFTHPWPSPIYHLRHFPFRLTPPVSTKTPQKI